MKTLRTFTLRLTAALALCAAVSACTPASNHGEFPAYSNIGAAAPSSQSMSIMDY